MIVLVLRCYQEVPTSLKKTRPLLCVIVLEVPGKTEWAHCFGSLWRQHPGGTAWQSRLFISLARKQSGKREWECPLKVHPQGSNSCPLGLPPEGRPLSNGATLGFTNFLTHQTLREHPHLKDKLILTWSEIKCQGRMS